MGMPTVNYNEHLCPRDMCTMAKRMAAALERKNGGNQSELGRYVGVSPQAVQKWLAGDNEPRGKNLRKVAEFVGVSEIVLLFGEDATQPQALTTSPSQVKPEDQPVTVDEIMELIALYQEAAPEGRALILDSARSAKKRKTATKRVRNQN